jgi:hypothetical protein
MAAVTSAAAGTCGANGSGLIAECTKAAPRDPNQVIVTLRAYQVKEFPTRVFDPNGEDGEGANATPPSLFVAERSCTDPDGSGCVFITDGPDLAVASSTAEVSPTTVTRGNPVSFPLQTVPVTNEGNREPTADYEIGFYLSAATDVAHLPRSADGTIQTEGATTYTRLLKTVPATGTQDVTRQSLLIPGATPVGTYYLYAYVDSQRVISELDEDNNIVQGGPITVTPAEYRILGLYTPCSGLTCTKKSGTSLPLAFGLTVDGVAAVDSQSTPPRFRVYPPASGGVCQTSGPFFVADPADVAPGGSGWQYFPVAGTRPAFTWQYNFQRTALGCYSIALEVPATAQEAGKTLGPVTWLSIYLTN